MAKQYSFKGDGASQETTVYGHTFPVDKFVDAPGLTAEQAAILEGNPMFESREAVAEEAQPEAVHDTAPEGETEH